MTNCLDVSPENGLTALARFLYKQEIFPKKNGKQIAVNTIRTELTALAKEIGYENPRGKKRK